MCGFAGYLSAKRFDHQALLNKMGSSITHRGPNASGVWFNVNDGLGFSHRRLSVIDLSEAGAQPMISQTGKYIIVFNGEIYNFQEIRKDIENEGKINWKGHSDTEIILAGFEIWNVEKTLKKMIGMFALALWDTETKVLYLVRDRIGEKPLYFGWQGQTFLFGSELKALQQHPEFKKEICLEALGQFFKYGCIPSGLSIYKGIQKLKPGTYCKISLADKEVKYYTYWNLNHYINSNIAEVNSIEENINRLENLLTDAVEKQMISDVPLGAFLSGGVDSSIIVALMQSKSNNPIKTFSIGFNEKGFDEAVHAKQVARHLGTDHTEMYVSAEESRNVIPLLADIYDEPFADSSQIPTYLVSKLAKTKVTVALSGDGGDELFAGYGKYLRVNNTWNVSSKIPKSIRKELEKFILRRSASKWNSFYGDIKSLLPKKYEFTDFGNKMQKFATMLNISSQSELHDSFTKHWDASEILSSNVTNHIWDLEGVQNLSFIERMMALDVKTYLPDDILAKLDRAAMANSLETRIPLLDHRIVEFALNLPINLKVRDGRGKWILRQVLYRYIPKALIERPKMGFCIPLDNWLRGPLKEWAIDMLSFENLNKHEFLNKQIVHQRLNEHLTGQKNWQNELWDVLMFQSWYDNNH